MTTAGRLGVGVDLMSVARMQQILAGPGAAGFVRRTFTAGEIAEAGTRSDPATFYAGRFAMKEAVFKALAVAWTAEDDPRDIEVTATEEGVPSVALSGHLSEVADAANVIDLSASLSHDEGWVMAVAVTLRGESAGA